MVVVMHLHCLGSTLAARLALRHSCVQELRATVAKLTAENRKLMRRTCDSDGSNAVATRGCDFQMQLFRENVQGTTMTNTWTSSAPPSSIQDSNSPKPTSKIASFIAEEPDKPDCEDDPTLPGLKMFEDDVEVSPTDKTGFFPECTN